MKVNSINVTVDGVKLTYKLDEFIEMCKTGKVDGIVGYKEDKNFIDLRLVKNKDTKEHRVVTKKAKDVTVKNFDAQLKTSFVSGQDIAFVFDTMLNGVAHNVSVIARKYLLKEAAVGQIVNTKLVGKYIDKSNLFCLVQVAEYSDGTEFTRFAVIELHVMRDGSIKSRLLGNMSDMSSFEDGRVYVMYNGQHIKIENVDFVVNSNYCLLSFKADLGDRVMKQNLVVKRKRW